MNLDELAKLICGDEGPAYRTNQQVRRLFERAQIPVPDDEWLSRRKLARAALDAASQSPGAIDRVMAYMADPAEYGGDQQVAHAVVDRLQHVIAAPQPKPDVFG